MSSFNSSIYSLLSSFGFSVDQKSAFQLLMQNSGILKTNQTIQDYFPMRDNYNDIALDILDLVEKTQQYLVLRNKFQERWEVKPLEWMANNTEQNLQILKDLDVYFCISPINKTPDAICILGATMPTMQERIDYTNMIYGKNISSKNLILLSGERYVTANVDASVEELQQIALLNNYDSYENLTETNLIQYLITNSGLNAKVKNTFVIDTPRGNLTRPTTQTTIIDLAKWLLDNPNIQYITFVSNQPYIKYQEAIIKETLKIVGSNIGFEVIGPEYKGNSVQSLVESLGARIFAMAPYVLGGVVDKVSDHKIIEKINETYASQPLIYNHLDQMFTTAHENSLLGQNVTQAEN